MSEEIMTKLDAVAKGIKEAQDLSKRNADKLDAIDEAQFQKIAEDVTKNLEEANTIKAAQKKFEEDIKNLEKKYCRPSGETSKDALSFDSKANFVKYLRNRTDKLSGETVGEIMNAVANKAFTGLTKDEIVQHAKDMAVGVNPRGGYWITPEMANFVVERQFETSPIRQVCRIQTISTESLEVPIDDDEAEAEWEGEVDTPNATDTPDIGLLTIHTHSLKARPKLTQKLLDDVAFNIEEWLQMKIADKFTRTENTAFVVGNGSKKPRGFLTYDPWTTPGTYERGKIEQRDSGSSGSFDADNLVDLQTDLLEVYQPSAVWMMKRKTFADVMKLKDGEDNYLLNFSLIAQGAPQVLLGKPVIFADDMPTVAADALAIAYGDFSRGYTIVDRLGISVLVDPYTDEPFIVYKSRKRVGGDVTNYQSIKILKLAV